MGEATGFGLLCMCGVGTCRRGTPAHTGAHPEIRMSTGSFERVHCSATRAKAGAGAGLCGAHALLTRLSRCKSVVCFIPVREAKIIPAHFTRVTFCRCVFQYVH